MGLFDVFTDITDVVTQPLGLSDTEGEKSARRAQEALMRLQAPNLTAPQLETPDLEEIARRFQLPPTELAKISTDPRLREAQYAALEKLQRTSNEGFTSEDRAALDEAFREEATRERGAREAALQRASQRGLGGSGLEMAELLGSRAASQERIAQRDLQLAAEGRRRALEAARQRAILGGDIRRQEFEEQSAVANAQDIINRFNQQALGSAAGTTALNRAELENQRRTQQALTLPQQQFANEQALAGLRGNAAAAVNNAEDFGAIGTTLNSAATSAGSAVGTGVGKPLGAGLARGFFG